MKVKITRPCRLFLTPDQEKPHTMGDVIEVESLDGLAGLVEVIEEEEKPKRKTRKRASKAEADPLDGDASNEDETEEE